MRCSWGPAPEGLSHLGCRTRAKQPLRPLVRQTGGHRSRAWRPPCHRAQLRRLRGTPSRAGGEEQQWRRAAGLQQLSPPGPGPLPLARSRFALPTHTGPPRAAAAAFPRSGLNYPPSPTAASPPPPRSAPAGSLRRPGVPSPPLGDVREHRRGFPRSSLLILQPRGPRCAQPTLKAPLSRSCPCSASPEAPGQGGVFPPLPEPAALPRAEGNGGVGAGAKGRLRGAWGIPR